MSSFDSVVLDCPKCGKEVEFQSKAGVCRLHRYKLSRVPASVALSLNGCEEVCSCGYTVTISTDHIDKFVVMYLDEEE